MTSTAHGVVLRRDEGRLILRLSSNNGFRVAALGRHFSLSYHTTARRLAVMDEDGRIGPRSTSPPSGSIPRKRHHPHRRHARPRPLRTCRLHDPPHDGMFRVFARTLTPEPSNARERVAGQ
jgi:hypothetical protein